MIKTCDACGIEKDMAAKEPYPYPEDDNIIAGPVDPLWDLDVQGDPIPGDPNGYSDFRRCLVCHECFHKLSPDMWIGKEHWEALSPKIPFEKLPPLPEKV